MGHLTTKDGYKMLWERYESSLVKPPKEEGMRRLLTRVLTEEEAAFASKVPLKPSSLGKVAAYTGVDRATAEDMLNKLAEKGVVFDAQSRGRSIYVLSPLMVGFFELIMMKDRPDMDQRAVAQTLHEITNEPGFMAELIHKNGTSMGRILSHEAALATGPVMEVYPHEEVSKLVAQHTSFAVGLCYCRHVASHHDRPCKVARMDNCLSLGSSAEYVVKHGIARFASLEEVSDILKEAEDQGLVHFVDNVKRKPGFVCSCCQCCCHAMKAFRSTELSRDTDSAVSAFVTRLSPETCNTCGRCIKRCPMGAFSLDKSTRPFRLRFDVDRCIGCGVCVTSCDQQALSLQRRPHEVFVPDTAMEKLLLIALEKGQLASLLFDDPRLSTHRAISRLVGFLFTLPPLTLALASRELKSRFVRFLTSLTRASGMPEV